MSLSEYEAVGAMSLPALTRLSRMSLMVTAFSRLGPDAGGISEGSASVSLATGPSVSKALTSLEAVPEPLMSASRIVAGCSVGEFGERKG